MGVAPAVAIHPPLADVAPIRRAWNSDLSWACTVVVEFGDRGCGSVLRVGVFVVMSVGAPLQHFAGVRFDWGTRLLDRVQQCRAPPQRLCRTQCAVVKEAAAVEWGTHPKDLRT